MVFYLLLTLFMVRVFAEMEVTKDVCTICNCTIPTVLNCSHRGLVRIPKHIDRQTTILNLSYNLIKHIDNGRIKKLSNLIVLDLYSNSLMLQNVSNSTFDGLTKLKVLNISKNDQFPLTNETTPPKLFENLTSLEVLKMYGTTGTYKNKEGYPDKHLQKLRSLKELWIDGRQNMKFGPGFRNISTLKVLRLAGDDIDPPWRSREYCCMTKIAKDTFDNFPTLTHLYVRKCHVQGIEDNAFQNLQHLQYLDLSLNSELTLGRVSSVFSSLQNNTETLVLNEIESARPQKYTVILTTKLAQSLSKVPLRELYLDNNRIELIDQDVFRALPKTLQVVSLKKNIFHQGLYIFHARNMENLTHLDLSYQFFKRKWAILHQAGKNDIIEAGQSSLQNKKIDMKQCEKFSDFYVPQNDSVHGVPVFTDNSVENYNDNNWLINEDENFKKNILKHTKSLETKHDISEHDLSDQVDLSFTCPDISNDNYIPPGTIIAYLPPKLEELDLSVSNLASPVSQLILNRNNSLKKLNVSQSLLYCWQGPVAGLENLQILDLSENYCYNISRNFFKSGANLKELYINDNLLGSTFASKSASEIMKPLTKLKVLNIGYNRIHKVPKNFFLSQRHLVKLFAYGNVIENFDVTIGHMTELRYLDVSLNYIGTLSETTRGELDSISSRIDNSTKNISLKVNLNLNRIHCYCYNIDFLNWILEHSRKNDGLDIQISECFHYRNLSRININSLSHLEQVVFELEKECQSYVGLTVGLAIVLVIIINIALGIIVHKHRWKIQYWYYVVFCNYKFRIKFGRKNYEEIGDTYKYDVFVASVPEGDAERMARSQNNVDFVMDKLRPALKDSNIIAFVQVYHIQGNGNLIPLIGRAINSSRVVLFVFTKDWSSDDGMKIAAHMWQCDMINRKSKSAILGIRMDGMTGTDSDMIQDLYCSKIIDYPNESTKNEEETFLRECTAQIQNLCKHNISDV